MLAHTSCMVDYVLYGGLYVLYGGLYVLYGGLHLYSGHYVLYGGLSLVWCVTRLSRGRDQRAKMEVR